MKLKHILFALVIFGISKDILAQHTLASYTFDDNATDISPNTNDGEIIGVLPTTDRFNRQNKAYNFNGTSYIDMGNDPSLDLKDGFSISAWVNQTGNGTFQTIVGQGFSNNGDYWLGLVSNGVTSNVRVWLDGQFYDGTTSLSVGWNHVAVTAQTGTNGIRIYLNGTLINTFTTSTDLEGSSVYNLRVGSDDQNEDYFFEGSIDEVTIYDKVLTQEQISIQYNSTPLNFNIDRADFGNALNFGENTNSWVNVPSDLIGPLTSFSFECWVNYSGSTNNDNAIGQGYTEGNIAYFSLFAGESNQLVTLNVRNFFFQVVTDNGFESYEVVNSVNIADSQWHHLAYTVDENTAAAKYYIDGEIVASNNSVPTFFSDFALLEAFYLGRDWTAENYFEGTLDEVRLWNYALSQEEIVSRRNIPLNGAEDGLLYYFDFNQGNANQSNLGTTTLIDKASGLNGEMFGFSLTGNQSNWVKNDISFDIVSPFITNVEPSATIAGKPVRIFGKNFHPFVEYNKILVGSTEAEISSITSNALEFILPEGQAGNQPIVLLTSSGSSNEVEFIRTDNQSLEFSFLRNPVSTSQFGAVNAVPTDINKDGYTDLVVSSRIDTETVQIYYNNSNFDLANGVTGQVPVELTRSIPIAYQEIFIEDLNGDGKSDILAHNSGGCMEWFSNSTWASQIISCEGIRTIYPGDLDNDGDVDIVGLKDLATDQLLWLENDGTGSFSTPQVIATGQLVLLIETQSNGLSLADLDGDFDLDIVLASNADRDNGSTSIGAQIYINNGNGNFEQKSIQQNVPSLGFDWRPTIGDFNNDGLNDIVHGGAFWPPTLYLNQGDNDFLSQSVSVPGFGQWVVPKLANNFTNTDLDGDGDIDFLYLEISPKSDSSVWWARNDGFVNGQVSFSDVRIESNLLASDSHIQYADMDNDGDLDVISASSIDNQLTVYKHAFSGNDFISFGLVEEVSPAVINTEEHTVDAVVDNTVALFRLVPEFTVSELASVKVDGVDQISGSSVADFRQPVIYKIEAENGDTQEWVVNVNSLPQAPLARDASTVRTTSFNANWDDGSDNDYFLLELSDNVEFSEPVVLDTIRGSLSAEVSGLIDGRSYWYRLRAGNQWGVSEYSNIIFVEQPILINELTFDEFISQSGAGSTSIDFRLSGGRNNYSVILRSKGILESTFAEITLTGDSNDNYSFEVTGANLDDVGMEFIIEVTDNFKTIVSSSQFIHWDDIEETIPITSFGGNQGDWQIFSIPFDLEDDLIESVFTVLGGSSYKKDWRLVRYQNSQFVDFREGLSRIELGKGYWFNSIQPVEITINGQVNVEPMVALRLAQGWNQIGNPYNVPISWNNIRSRNNIEGTVGAAQIFDNTRQSFSEGDVIQPFAGAFVWSDETITVETLLQNDFASGRKWSGKKTGSDIDDEEWVFELSLIEPTGENYLAAIGMHPEASPSKDKYDKTELPFFIQYAQMSTSHPEYFYPKFNRDIRPNSLKETWLFTLSSKQLTGTNTIQWDNASLESTNSQLWLIDEENGSLINMSDQNSYAFNYKNDHQFSFHFTSSRDERPIPINLILGDPYPNPTSGSTQITVSLPESDNDQEIDLCLYDINGRKVIDISNGKYSAGTHIFSISKKNIQALESGVYLYRFISSESSPAFKKLIIKQ